MPGTTPNVRHADGGIPEERIAQERLERLRAFVRLVAGRVPPGDEVRITGSGDVRHRLGRFLREENHRLGRRRRLDTRASGPVTEQELVAHGRELAGTRRVPCSRFGESGAGRSWTVRHARTRRSAPLWHAVRHSLATLPTPKLNLVIQTSLAARVRWTGTPVLISTTRCKGCELCVAACPHHALELDLGTVNPLGHHPVALIAPELCTSCAFCARVCPDAVLTVLAPPKAGAG